MWWKLCERKVIMKPSVNVILYHGGEVLYIGSIDVNRCSIDVNQWISWPWYLWGDDDMPITVRKRFIIPLTCTMVRDVVYLDTLSVWNEIWIKGVHRLWLTELCLNFLSGQDFFFGLIVWTQPQSWQAESYTQNWE